MRVNRVTQRKGRGVGEQENAEHDDTTSSHSKNAADGGVHVTIILHLHSSGLCGMRHAGDYVIGCIYGHSQFGGETNLMQFCLAAKAPKRRGKKGSTVLRPTWWNLREQVHWLATRPPDPSSS